MVCVRRSILYLFFMTLFFPLSAFAAGLWNLDTTFNSPNGTIQYPNTFIYGEQPNSVAIQQDGKIVVVNNNASTRDEQEKPLYQIEVLRYNANGTLDTDFGHFGQTRYDQSFLSFATDVAIQQDGKIVVAGFRSQNAEGWQDVLVLRYNTDGSPDASFNDTGEVTFQNNVWFTGVGTMVSLAIQDGGKILVASSTIVTGGIKNAIVLRYKNNGIIDDSFGENGVVSYKYYTEQKREVDNISRRIKIAPDKSIAVLIQAGDCAKVLRFTTDGLHLPESQLFCGQMSPQGNLSKAYPWGMAIQQDGKIVVVGEAGVFPFVLRYTSTGQIDTSFGPGTGVVFFNYRDHFGYSDEAVRPSIARSVLIQPDGSILLVGSCPMNHDAEDKYSDYIDILLLRFSSNGSLDASFGVNGALTFDGGWRNEILESARDVGQAITTQSDGKIIVVGNMSTNSVGSGNHYDLIVMRFECQPSPDIDVSPLDYDYGEVPTGSAKAQRFNISNVGQLDLTVTNIELIGEDNARFSIDPTTCQNLTPTIVPGGSCFITIRFVPGSEGLKAATLRITSNDPYARAISYGPVEVSLTGTGIAAESSYTLTVSTDGNGVGIVQSKPKGIKCGKNWADCTEPYAAGKEITLYRIIEQEESKFVGWSGACSGMKECKIVMDSDKEVKATFKADPTLVMWPKYRDFRNVKIGRMKAAFFVVKNSTKNGRKPLEVGPIELLQTPSPFQIFEDECSGMVLEPRESCVFGVLFEPEVAGAYTTEVKIPSNDPAALVTAIQLSGNGVAPPPPKPPRKK